MSLKNLTQVRQPSGKAISLAISQQGDLYAGWSNGSIIKLPHGSDTFGTYVKGVKDRPTNLKRRTPRSEFEFVKPIGIDAWGANYNTLVTVV